MAKTAVFEPFFDALRDFHKKFHPNLLLLETFDGGAALRKIYNSLLIHVDSLRTNAGIS